MAWHALSLLINQLHAFTRSAMQMCVIPDGSSSMDFYPLITTDIQSARVS